MRFEIFDTSRLEKLNSDLEIEPSPFLSEENQKNLSKFHLMAQEDPREFSKLAEEMNFIEAEIQSETGQFNELRDQLKELLAQILNRQKLAESFAQKVNSLNQEIEDLIEESSQLPDVDKKYDKVIKRAMSLLIEGKKYKLSNISSPLPEGFADYQKNLEDFQIQEAKFRTVSENLAQTFQAAKENFKKIDAFVKFEEAEKEKVKRNLSLEAQGLDAVIPSNIIKQNKYKKLLGK